MKKKKTNLTKNLCVAHKRAEEEEEARQQELEIQRRAAEEEAQRERKAELKRQAGKIGFIVNSITEIR